MLSDDKFKTLVEICKEVTAEDFFVFDTSVFSTGVDAGQASFLMFTHRFSFKMFEAISDLFVFDWTGCIDSELL